ncbi:hypothetical protein QEN19_003016 [Hanseniaspora menglaensis]
MEFENFLFELSPLFSSTVNELAENQNLHDKVLTKLDELAVALRSEFNRDLIRESGILQELSNLKYDPSLVDIFSEVIRCLANAVADNDTNRQLISDNLSLMLIVKSIIERIDYNMDKNSQFEIGKRSLILIRNLYLDQIPKNRELLEGIVMSLIKFILTNFQTLIINLNDDYLSEMSKIVFDLLSSFFDDEKIYTEESFYNACIPPYPQLLTLLEEYTKRIAKMGSIFQDSNDYENSEEDDYEEPCDLTNLILLSEIIEKLLKKGLQLTEEDDSLSGLKLLLSSLNNLENCDFQFPSKLILLRRLSFLIQCVTSNLGLDIPVNDFRNQLPFDLTLYSFENIFNLFEVISRDKSAKKYQISCLSFIIANMLDDKSNMKKWQNAYSISKYIKLVYENYQFADAYLYIPLLDLIRKSIGIMNIIEDQSSLEMMWRWFNDHVVDRVDMIQDLSRYYKLLMNKLLAIEYGQVLYNSNILSYEKLYSKDYVFTILLISKLSKYLLQSGNNSKLYELIETSIKGVSQEKERVTNVLPEFFKAIGVYIREYSLANNVNVPFYLYDHKEKFIQLLKMVIEDTQNQSPATLNNLKFCVGMILSNENIKNKFFAEDIFTLKALFSQI